jgi:hypothetical protein
MNRDDKKIRSLKKQIDENSILSVVYYLLYEVGCGKNVMKHAEVLEVLQYWYAKLSQS